MMFGACQLMQVGIHWYLITPISVAVLETNDGFQNASGETIFKCIHLHCI